MRTPPKNKKIDYDELRGLWEAGWTHKQIMSRYGVSDRHLTRVRRQLGLRRPNTTRKVDWTEASRLRVEEHWTYRQIADKFGCNYDNVKKRLKHPLPKIIKSICECGRRKSTASKKCQICRRAYDYDLALYLFHLGYTPRSISSVLGVESWLVLGMVRRRNLRRTHSASKLLYNTVRRELTIEEAIELYFRAVTEKQTPPTLDDIKQARESQKLARIKLLSEFSSPALDTSSDTCNTSDT